MREMMRWLWRDGPVSTDPNDMLEHTFREPVVKKNYVLFPVGRHAPLFITT